MRGFIRVLGVLALAVAISGCVFKGGTDLSDVAGRVGLSNITTGDGTYENYTATGYYTGTEVGIGVGIPYLIKLIELYPAKSNEDLLTEVAQKAKDDQAEAMINVHPQSDLYTGFPFFLIGIYIDSTNGTGIKTKMK